MTTDKVDATPPLSMSGPHIFPSSSLPIFVGGGGLKEVSPRMYWQSDAVFPLDYNRWQVLPRDIPHSTESVPDLDDKARSHGCQRLWPYNPHPAPSVLHDDPPFEPQHGQHDPDSPSSDANRDYEFLDEDSGPAPLLTDVPLSSSISSLAPVDSPPLSESPGVASIPVEGQLSGFSGLTINPPVAELGPYGRSHENQQHREAWTSDFASVASSVGTIAYRGNNVEAIIPYHGLQESFRQVSYQPRPIPRPYPILSSSRPPAAYASNFHTVPVAGRVQSRRATNVQQRPEKKYTCSLCRGEFTLPQVLKRHKKDVHDPKEACSHCSLFTFSRGRPYLYRKHVENHHPEIPLPEVRQRSPSSAEDSSNPHGLGPKQASANYVPLLTRDAPIHNMSYYPSYLPQY